MIILERVITLIFCNYRIVQLIKFTNHIFIDDFTKNAVDSHNGIVDVNDEKGNTVNSKKMSNKAVNRNNSKTKTPDASDRDENIENLQQSDSETDSDNVMSVKKSECHKTFNVRTLSKTSSESYDIDTSDEEQNNGNFDSDDN